MSALLFSHILFYYEREVDKGKKFLKYYSLNVREPLEIDTSLRFLRTSYNSMSWGCSGILKSSIVMVSNR